MGVAKEKLLAGGALALVLALLAAVALLAANPQLSLSRLGYPGCAFFAWTGKPCPLCGSVAAAKATLRGRLDVAWDANPFAALLTVSLIASAPLLAVALLWPGSVTPVFKTRLVRSALFAWGAALLLVLVLSWIARLL